MKIFMTLLRRTYSKSSVDLIDHFSVDLAKFFCRQFD